MKTPRIDVSLDLASERDWSARTNSIREWMNAVMT